MIARIGNLPSDSSNISIREKLSLEILCIEFQSLKSSKKRFIY
jgi:hypothetical protein